ncbi:MAG: hypothetical protein KC657_03455 [Myxococcales bacterium]|nr:hypothetical protein [Myxococcales bacterium]
MIRTWTPLFAAVALVAACSSSSTNDGTSSSGGASSGSSGASSGSSGASSSGSSGASSGSSGSSGPKYCAGGTCTEAEGKPYADCVIGKCDTQYQECYGPGYKTGTYGGSCGPYLTCVQKCACDDTACFQACGAPQGDCQTCLQKVSTCVQGSGCQAPACASVQPDAGGGGGKTCADLAACCAKIADNTKKTQCQGTYDQVKASGDATCNLVYTQYAADCP